MTSANLSRSGNLPHIPDFVHCCLNTCILQSIVWTFRKKRCDRDVESFDVVPLSQPAEDCGPTRTSGNAKDILDLLDCCDRRRTTQLVSLVSRTLLIGSVADHRST